MDGLRAIAVGAVIAFHLSDTRVPGAFIGVDVFFVISGFVITATLLREHDREGRIALIPFYRRRWWRLGPAQVAVILLTLPLVLVSGVQPLSAWFREAALGITYTYNLGQAVRGDPGSTVLNHLWSLSVEEQFHLVLPPLLALGLIRGLANRPRRLLLWMLGAIALFAALRWVTALALGNLVAFFLPWSRFDEFLCGAVVAVVLHSRETAPRFLTSPWPAVVASSALLAAVPLVHIFDSSWMYAGGFLGVAVCAAIVVGHLCSAPGSVLSRPMAWDRWSGWDSGRTALPVPLAAGPRALHGGNAAVVVRDRGADRSSSLGGRVLQVAGVAVAQTRPPSRAR